MNKSRLHEEGTGKREQGVRWPQICYDTGLSFLKLGHQGKGSSIFPASLTQSKQQLMGEVLYRRIRVNDCRGKNRIRKSSHFSSNEATDEGKDEWPLKPAGAQLMGNLLWDSQAGHT